MPVYANWKSGNTQNIVIGGSSPSAGTFYGRPIATIKNFVEEVRGIAARTQEARADWTAEDARQTGI